MTDPAPTVFLVDDDAAIRDSLSLLIGSEGYAVSTYASASDFLEARGTDVRGCVVADLRMPGMDGLGLQEEMARRGTLLPIIFLTAYGDIPSTVRAIKAGAVDFLTKPVAGTDLLRAIADAVRVDGSRCAEKSRNVEATARVATLTARERAVMQLAAEGLSNKAIGKQLGISHRTVEIHRSRVMKKTGASGLIDLTQIVRMALPAK